MAVDFSQIVKIAQTLPVSLISIILSNVLLIFGFLLGKLVLYKAEDAVKFFHSLSTGSSKRAKLNTLYTAPTQIKSKLLQLIAQETTHKEQGKIIMKANACVDTDIINALYKASQAGVVHQP